MVHQMRAAGSSAFLNFIPSPASTCPAPATLAAMAEPADPADMSQDMSLESVSDADLAPAVEKLSLKDGPSGNSSARRDSSKSRRPIIVYTRRQLLYLYDSPLVVSPEGLPALRDWFG